jgi:hypothetical protein
MNIHELISESEDLNETIYVGDEFDVELDDIVLE